MTNKLEETVKTRDAVYGGFENVAAIAQQFKTIMKQSPSYTAMNAVAKEGMEMVLHKCARLLAGDPNHLDSWHDIQGYAKLVEDRLPKAEVVYTASGCQGATPMEACTYPMSGGAGGLYSPTADGYSVDGSPNKSC